MNANQGSGDKMGQAVGGVINTSGQVTDKARGAYQGAGTAAAQAGTVKVDQDVMNRINGGASSVDPSTMAAISSGFDQKSGKYTGPGSVPDSAKYSGPDSYNAGTYTGPGAAASMGGQAGTDRTAYQGLANILSGNLKNANGGQAGVAALEKSIYQQPSYTAGENNLDAFLTGGSSSYQQGLKDMNSTWGGEEAKGQAADTAINEAINSGRKTSEETQNAYNSAIQSKKEQSAATQKAYQDAIAAQQAKQAAWQPPQPPPPAVAPATQPGGEVDRSSYNPLGIGKKIVDAVGTAGNDIANQAKQTGNNGPTYLPTSQAAPEAFQGVVDAVTKAPEDTKNAAKEKANSAAKTVKKWSDQILKENVESIPLEDLKEFFGCVQPYFYTYINQEHGQGVHSGFMAQDLLKSKLGRTIVSMNQDGLLEIDTWKLQGALVAAMKHVMEQK